MKHRAAIFCLCYGILIPAIAGTFHARWNFTFPNGQPLGVREFRLQILGPYGSADTNILTGDYLARPVNSLSSLIVSNLYNGRSYRVTFLGPNWTTIFTNNFDTNVAGLVNAVDYLSAPLQVDGSTVAYSQLAADARFHNVAGDTSTNPIFRGTIAFPDGSVSNYVWTCTNTATGAGTWQPASGGLTAASPLNATNLFGNLDPERILDLPVTNLASGAAITLRKTTVAMNYTITADSNVPGFLGTAAGFQRSAFITVTNSTASPKLWTFPQSVNFQGTNVVYVDATNQVSVTIFYNGAATNGFKANNYRLP